MENQTIEIQVGYSTGKPELLQMITELAKAGFDVDTEHVQGQGILVKASKPRNKNN